MRSGILVTGGAGFIGSEFVRQLCAENEFKKIYVLDKLTYAGNLLRIQKEITSNLVEFIHADVSDVESYVKALQGVDYAVHFAAESHVDNSIKNGIPFLESNIMGTYRLLEACRANQVGRTLVVSTDEVYGSIERGETDESVNLKPSSAYSASKAAADLFALAQHKTFQQDVVITRGCNTYGPFQHEEKFIPRAIGNLLAGKPVPLYGTGENVREWMHVSDHAKGIKQVLLQGRPGEIYNLGSGTRKTNKQIIDLLLGSLNFTWDKVDYVTDRLGHDYRYALNSTKVRREIGWKATVDFDAGFLNTLDWYRKEGLLA